MQRHLLLIVLIFSCSAPTKENALIKKKSPLVIDVTLFSSEYGGFGYDISVNGKALVHQPNIPTIAGNKGFPTEQNARMVANLVIQKIKENQIPPSLTADEVRTAMID
jgi:hypothetical protein